jgi:NAD(P)-dependent dehydrogenase (short-subunit alcohol dehydrogenase family)
MDAGEAKNRTVADDASQRDFVAVFVGATSGIGLETLKALCRKISSGKIYVIGRSQARFQPELEKLRESKHNATVTFIEAEIALIRGVDQACAIICANERKLDLLYMSPGYLGVGGPHCSSLLVNLQGGLS